MMSMVLELELNDEVKVVLESGKLYDSSHHYTHFSGYLIEQEVAFSAYRDSEFDIQSDTPITYVGTYVNTENGLNPSSGKFKAPVTGTYAIHFNAVNIDTSSSRIQKLYLKHKSSIVTYSALHEVMFEYQLTCDFFKKVRMSSDSRPLRCSTQALAAN